MANPKPQVLLPPQNNSRRPVKLLDSGVMEARHTALRGDEAHIPLQQLTLDNNAQPERNRKPSMPPTAKMMIFLETGEVRLVTFMLPKVSISVAELLEQLHIPFDENAHVQCMQLARGEIDYYLSVGRSERIEDTMRRHPELKGILDSDKKTEDTFISL